MRKDSDLGEHEAETARGLLPRKYEAVPWRRLGVERVTVRGL